MTTPDRALEAATTIESALRLQLRRRTATLCLVAALSVAGLALLLLGLWVVGGLVVARSGR